MLVEMVSVPAGSFKMGGGDIKNRPDALPVHQVTVSKDFLIAKEPIKYDLFAEFYREEYGGEVDAENYLGYVIGVSWYEANRFCAWLSRKTGLPHRLPTEAEWEYCARNSRRFGIDRMCDLNMREWCFDWYDSYTPEEQHDPAGPDSGLFKVVRGGFLDSPRRYNIYHLDVWARGSLPPSYRHFPSDPNNFGRHNVGFRVVQGEPVQTNGKSVSVPLSLHVRQSRPQAQVSSEKPYFRKRYLFPIPPDTASSEAIAAFGLNPLLRHHNHSPGFDVAPNGDLIVSIYSSFNEHDPEVGLMGARLRYGADEWEMPDIWLNTVGVNDHAPLLFTNRDGTIYHFWGWPQLDNAFPFQFVYSKDCGATWSEVQFPRFREKAEKVVSQPINTVIHAQDGYYYVPCDVAGESASVLWRSKDLVNWEVPKGVTAGRHSTVVELKDGRLLAIGGKNSSIDGYMPQAVSADRGDSWEVSKTPFPTMTSGQRPCVIRLMSGRLLYCGDFQTKMGRRPPGAADDHWGSFVAFSEDEGATWVIKKLWGTQHKKQDPTLLGGAHTLGYSVCRQSPDGLIHIITSNNRPCLHLCFNEAWLLADTGNEFPSDEELMHETVTEVHNITTYTETYTDGTVKCVYSGGTASDGRFLLHGEEKWYYPSGALMTEAQYRLGRRVGTYTHYSPGGCKIWEWEYLEDNVAVYKTFYPDGKLKTVGRYKNRIAQGWAEQYTPDGSLSAKILFENGVVVKTEQYPAKPIQLS